MRRYLFLSALLVTILSPQLPATAYADTEQAPTVNWTKLNQAWENYIYYPSSENAYKVYVLLPDKRINYTGKKNEQETMEYIYSELGMLERQVYASDRNALKVAFRLMTISDAGFSEELDHSIILMVRINPKLFLEELKDHLHLVDLESFLLDYGYDLNPYETNAWEMEKAFRIKALKSVTDKSLSSLRDKCINILETSTLER